MGLVDPAGLILHVLILIVDVSVGVVLRDVVLDAEQQVQPIALLLDGRPDVLEVLSVLLQDLLVALQLRELRRRYGGVLAAYVV